MRKDNLRSIGKTTMKAYEIQSYLQSLNEGWVIPTGNIDTFKSGNPEDDVHGVAVGWMSYTWALKRALELGCNVFITHEPTYYTHQENDERMFRFEGAQNKRRFIEQNHLVIIRCHDLWDQIRDIGIPDSWASQLGFSNPIAGEGYYRIYDVSGKTAVDVARQVLDHTRSLGQEVVQLTGPAEKPVSRVAIGTGAGTPFLTFIEKYQADIAICTDDGMRYYSDGAFAIDMDIPLIVVNHPVSEEPGIINLAKHLQSKFPLIPIHHIPQRCMYQIVSDINGSSA
jgi:putative NIF3 family GTP cyclohydrolase 1 type 2